MCPAEPGSTCLTIPSQCLPTGEETLREQGQHPHFSDEELRQKAGLGLLPMSSAHEPTPGPESQCATNVLCCGHISVSSWG